MLKTILLIEKDSSLKDFFSRVFYIDGYEVIYLKEEEKLNTLSESEIAAVDMLVIDECEDPSAFMQKFNTIFNKSEKESVPVLGVLKKGEDPEPAHSNFDAVMVKDNFNIQLLCDLVERLTS